MVKYRRHNANISGRGIVDFKFGNELAIRKLIKEDSDLSDFRARICWSKLQIMIIKSSLKKLKISLAFKSAIYRALKRADLIDPYARKRRDKKFKR